MDAKHTPMHVIAAKVLCKRGAEMCDVNFEDSWKQYGEDYLRDAQAVLDAVGAPDLLEALQDLMAAIYYTGPDVNDRIGTAEDVALKAIKKATGAAE